MAGLTAATAVCTFYCIFPTRRTLLQSITRANVILTEYNLASRTAISSRLSEMTPRYPFFLSFLRSGPMLSGFLVLFIRMFVSSGEN